MSLFARKNAIGALLATLLTCLPAAAHAALVRGPGPLGPPTGVLVHVSPDGDLRSVISAVEALGVPTGTAYERIGVFVARPPRTLLSDLLGLPGVTHVEPNRALEYHLDTAHEATRVLPALHAYADDVGRVD